MTDITEQSQIGIGIIGAGARGIYNLGREIISQAEQNSLRITALCDRRRQRLEDARQYLQDAMPRNEMFRPHLFDDHRKLIQCDDVDLIIITSPTDCHREHATAALRSGKKVYCDKPLAQNAEDAVAIAEAERETDNPLIMGFTRRYEAPWQRAHTLIDDGAIGRPVMMLMRNVIPYWHYLSGWWRRREWSGGALNDKGAHICDVFNWFSASRARQVCGMGGRSIIEPDPSAPRHCSECDRDCAFRSRNQEEGPQDETAHFGESWLNEPDDKFRDDVCVYNTESDIYHHTCIQYAYENGMTAQYFYTIVGPQADDQETFEMVGTNGRLILTRHEAEIDLVRRHPHHHEVIDCSPDEFSQSHFGADAELVRELERFYHGAAPRVPASAGLEATRMIMAALQSLDSDGQSVNMGNIKGHKMAASSL